MHHFYCRMSQQLLRLRVGIKTLRFSSRYQSSYYPFKSSQSAIGRQCFCGEDSFPKLVFRGGAGGCLLSPAAAFHTVSSSQGQGALYSEYKAPTGLATASSVTSELIGKKRYDDRRETPLTQKLVSARSLEEILLVLEDESTEMLDVISLSVAVETLFDMLKNETALSLKAKHQILTAVGTQKLSKVLRRHAPHMDPADLINAVKLFSYLSVPGNHFTFQILLKLISKHANLLDLQQLMYMQFLLDKMHSCSKSALSKALQFALPVVFESKLSTQGDRNDPHGLCDYLHYATKYKISDKSISMLIESATRILDRFPSKSAKSLLWSLCDTESNDTAHGPLAVWCFKKITESMNDLKLKDISTTIGKVSKRYSHRAPYFYNEDFMNAFCQRMVQPDVDPEVVLWAVKNVAAVRHVNIEFIDRVGEIIASNPSLILNNDHLYSVIVKGLAILNYKPEKWSTFSSILLEHPALTKPYTVHDISLAYDLFSLDLFPENMVRVLYSAEGLPVLDDFFARSQLPYALLQVYNSIKLLNPNYMGPLPPISMVEQWKEASRAIYANRQSSLKAALQTGLGGESYVINGLYHDGLHIDHGILMRKGGYPVAVNSQSDSQLDCLSNITKPPESVIILVKVCTPDLYANNTRRLKGGAALELKLLESLGHPLVVVDLQGWMELSDHEKIPFLMHRIREKMEHFQWNQNWGDVIPP